MVERSFAMIDWGRDDARNDDKLRTYFVSVPAYNEVVLGKRRYLLGRKGTGKTALLERIRLAALHEHSSTWRITNLSLRNFPLGSLRDLKDKSYRDKAQFVPVWTFLIAVELARLVVSDAKQLQDPHVNALKNFLSANFAENLAGFTDAVQQLKEKGGQLQVSSLGTLSGKQSEQQTYTRHFHETTRLLLDHLLKVSSKNSYYVLIDELDEGFRAGDPSIRLLLLALFRAVEDVIGHLTTASPHYRVVLALRDDIFDSLEDSDLNKLDDFVARLQWSAAPTTSSLHAGLWLRDVVTARIRASLALKGADPWATVVVDDDPYLPPKVSSMWAYLTNRTYDRPRDIIKFLKYCAKHHRHGRLTLKSVVAAEPEYSDWLYRELRDEIHSFLPVWKEAFQAIAQLGSGVVETTSLKRQFDDNETISEWLRNNNQSADYILSMFFDYGVIGSYTAHKVWSFKYKDSLLAWNPRSRKVLVHWGLIQKLRLVRDVPVERG